MLKYLLDRALRGLLHSLTGNLHQSHPGSNPSSGREFYEGLNIAEYQSSGKIICDEKVETSEV